MVPNALPYEDVFVGPDGGKTVYKRAFGSDKRELVEDFENEQNS